MLDPDAIAADTEARENASALAALVAHYYEALRDLRLPEALCVAVVVDWHSALITDGVAWEEDDDED